MRRRDFIAGAGAAALLGPVRARAQRSMPLVGFVNAASPEGYQRPLAAFLKGLGEAGYEDRRNLAIEYRWANGQYDRLPALIDELIQRKVAVIAATSTPAVVAAKKATNTVPIVFTTSGDPIQLQLVTSLSRPGGNVTGATQLNVEAAPKRLELLHEALPRAKRFGLLVNPINPLASPVKKDLSAAATSLGVELHVLEAKAEQDFAAVFDALAALKAEALVIGTDVFFNSHSEDLAALTIRYRIPAIYQYPDFTAAGGLMSYGGNVAESYRLAGLYVGRILKGERAGDLPVQEVTKVELIINLKTAKALGVTFPLSLLGRADEVIE